MTQPAAIQATFYDWRTVKTRKQLQLVFEVPIEQMEDVMRVLGVPAAHEGIWCAIARLEIGVGYAAKRQDEKGGFDTWPRSKQAGFLCKQPAFQKWLGVSESSDNEEVEATSRVRLICEVESRSALDTDDSAASRWDEIIYRYREATGQTTERLW